MRQYARILNDIVGLMVLTMSYRGECVRMGG